MAEPLVRAWEWRKQRGLFGPDPRAAVLRVFHGPGEGAGDLRDYAIDWFAGHAWVTAWTDAPARLPEIRDFLAAHGALSAVALVRPARGLPEMPHVLCGQPPAGRFPVDEKGQQVLIQLQDARHPGLFLDHAPLRQWLRAHARGWRVLNTFAYTGSLSIAAGLGGAREVATLDLSRATVQWAEENWRANRLSEGDAQFIAGDVFAELPRLARAGRVFDCVILDPPSFSRSKRGSFSTAKDLGKLHGLALDVLAPGGVLITSINSADIPRTRFEAEVDDALTRAGRRFDLVERLAQPETFPPASTREEDHYLKGLILREDAAPARPGPRGSRR